MTAPLIVLGFILLIGAWVASSILVSIAELRRTFRSQ